jgi:hypothetical protein
MREENEEMIPRKDRTNISGLIGVLAAAWLLVGVVSPVLAASWLQCGTLADIANCQIANRPSARYEYAIAYITAEPVPVVCTFWNVGERIANKEPLLIFSDNPSTGMRYGGFVFYRDTQAADDNCPAGGFRHRYWWLTVDTEVEANASNGCFSTTIPIYCRRR